MILNVPVDCHCYIILIIYTFSFSLSILAGINSTKGISNPNFKENEYVEVMPEKIRDAERNDQPSTEIQRDFMSDLATSSHNETYDSGCGDITTEKYIDDESGYTVCASKSSEIGDSSEFTMEYLSNLKSKDILDKNYNNENYNTDAHKPFESYIDDEGGYTIRAPEKGESYPTLIDSTESHYVDMSSKGFIDNDDGCTTSSNGVERKNLTFDKASFSKSEMIRDEVHIDFNENIYVEISSEHFTDNKISNTVPAPKRKKIAVPESFNESFFSSMTPNLIGDTMQIDRCEDFYVETMEENHVDDENRYTVCADENVALPDTFMITELNRNVTQTDHDEEIHVEMVSEKINSKTDYEVYTPEIVNLQETSAAMLPEVIGYASQEINTENLYDEIKPRVRIGNGNNKTVCESGTDNNNLFDLDLKLFAKVSSDDFNANETSNVVSEPKKKKVALPDFLNKTLSSLMPELTEDLIQNDDILINSPEIENADLLETFESFKVDFSCLLPELIENSTQNDESKTLNFEMPGESYMDDECGSTVCAPEIENPYPFPFFSKTYPYLIPEAAKDTIQKNEERTLDFEIHGANYVDDVSNNLIGVPGREKDAFPASFDKNPLSLSEDFKNLYDKMPETKYNDKESSHMQINKSIAQPDKKDEYNSIHATDLSDLPTVKVSRPELQEDYYINSSAVQHIEPKLKDDNVYVEIPSEKSENIYEALCNNNDVSQVESQFVSNPL